MKKSLLALAVLGAIAGTAQADSSVTIYGAIDIGVVKVKNQTTALGRGDNNKLGFKGVEDLGGGLSAIFQLEMRYEPDTGTTESAPNRPLFQGQTRVGLKGEFGTIRLGRGLTAFQESIGAYEPWSFDSNRANLVAFSTANYSSDPAIRGSSGNRLSNAVFYNTPVWSGFQANFTVASKENVSDAAGRSFAPTSNAYSFSSTYNNGPFSGLVAYERNGYQDRLWSVAATFKVLPQLKLLGSYTQNRDGGLNPIATTPAPAGFKTKGAVFGAQWTVGNGVILAGYGRNKPDNREKTDQFSLGYEYNLSKRTFLYVDGFNNRKPSAPGTSSNSNQFDMGIHHSF